MVADNRIVVENIVVNGWESSLEIDSHVRRENGSRRSWVPLGIVGCVARQQFGCESRRKGKGTRVGVSYIIVPWWKISAWSHCACLHVSMLGAARGWRCALE